MKAAIYPGSFDPITNGHLNIIGRCVKIFDKLIITIANNSNKKTLFSTEDRIFMIKEATKIYKNVEIDFFEGLLVNYLRKRNAYIVIRGLRAISDFEYEFQMAHMNHNLCPEMETFFMMTGDDEFFISSNIIREIASLKGNIKKFVPPVVEEMFEKKLKVKSEEIF